MREVTGGPMEVDFPMVVGAETSLAGRYTGAQIARAWLPFAILSVFVILWGLPSLKAPMNKATTPVWNAPMLHNAVTRAAPVVSKPTPEAAKYDFNWLTATGTGFFSPPSSPAWYWVCGQAESCMSLDRRYIACGTR